MTTRWRAPVRYGFVSAATWLIDFGVFALTLDHLGPVPAMIIARVTALVFAFPAHRWFSFSAEGSLRGNEVVGYLALWGANLALATALVAALDIAAPAYPLAIKLAVEVIVFGLNYVVLRRLFRP
jgi:putative flippase GtrA